MPTDYKELRRRKDNAAKELREVCPAIDRMSGIYFLIRKDQDGKHAYIGKASDLIERMTSHLLGYVQRIDVSLKKRGFYSLSNPEGWVLNVLHFSKDELDEKERYFITAYANAGYDLYNVESGGTDGKTIIGERKPPKTYRDGLSQGRRTLARELKHIIDTHLVIELKKPSKISIKALDKFWQLLESEE